MSVDVLHGDCLQILPTLSGLDVCICDPPYHLTSIVQRFGGAGAAPAQFGTDGAFARASRGFMGKQWDGGDIAFRPETWRLVYDALKPGAHLLAFGGSRTFARMFCAIEDAGFEYRDTLMWLYGTGFPKSHDVSKGVDKLIGAKRTVIGRKANLHSRGSHKMAEGWHRPWMDDPEVVDLGMMETAPGSLEAARWAGWGTALKPSFEPIGLFRKPLDNGTVAANVLKHGTGALNIDACRVGTSGGGGNGLGSHFDRLGNTASRVAHGDDMTNTLGRWPANVLHDGSDEVEAAFAQFSAPGQQGRARTGGALQGNNTFGALRHISTSPEPRGDTGTASRFFYSAKASKADRAGSKHPTVKPLALMRWLCRLVTPPGGRILDCFAGSGTTGEAALLEGFSAVLIEREDEYVADINRRIARAQEERTTIVTTNQLDMFA